MTFWAHTSNDRPSEPLENHLDNVANGQGEIPGAADFADAFGAREYGRLLGLWHDLGKYAVAFQDYLHQSSGDADSHVVEMCRRVDHSTAGARYANRKNTAVGRILAYCIAGHHAGLPDSGKAVESALDFRLNRPRPETLDALARIPTSNDALPFPTSLPLLHVDNDPRRRAFQIAFFIRFLFSCLVDADFLHTERYMQPDRAAARAFRAPSIAELASQLDKHLQRLGRGAEDTIVNRWRGHVLQSCIEVAACEPGLFSLTVPTGGGKTLSGLAFALHHTAHHALRRVIVAIPFTSIIEQNAAVYRRALGKWSDAVLEHHSNLDVRNAEQQNSRSRLAAENWDAPLVVTTNVQLLESLFACRSSRCRKLHRIARSVIVLDEAQALPPDLLAPTLAALRELVTNYGCSIVLCTATQPALEQCESFPIGLDKPRPIIAEPRRRSLFGALKRVDVKTVGVLDDQALVEQLSDEPQVLCVVNTRRHAADLFAAMAERFGQPTGLRGNGWLARRMGVCLHLSASMCPQHRSTVLRAIRRRLDTGEPCRVISTQLVEAGVDIDFPVVYRAMAGLDSIAQAAGRCNREGLLAGHGRVIVFDSEKQVPPFVRGAVNAAQEVIPDHADLLSVETQAAYFRKYYWDKGNSTKWDRPPNATGDGDGVLDCFNDSGNYLQFRKAAQRYRLIADDQQPVLIPYGRRGKQCVDELLAMKEPPNRLFDRLAQRFVVTVRERDVGTLIDNTVLYPLNQTHGRLVLANEDAYDCLLGLRADVAGFDPEILIN